MERSSRIVPAAREASIFVPEAVEPRRSSVLGFRSRAARRVDIPDGLIHTYSPATESTSTTTLMIPIDFIVDDCAGAAVDRSWSRS